MPSRTKAAGHRIVDFHPVTVSQYMLSKFQAKKPEEKVIAPAQKRTAMVDLVACGMREPASE